jgi:hypothetical protein
LQFTRKFGVAYNTALLLYSNILQAMSEHVDSYLLKGKVEIGDAYSG